MSVPWESRLLSTVFSVCTTMLVLYAIVKNSLSVVTVFALYTRVWPWLLTRYGALLAVVVYAPVILCVNFVCFNDSKLLTTSHHYMLCVSVACSTFCLIFNFWNFEVCKCGPERIVDRICGTVSFKYRAKLRTQLLFAIHAPRGLGNCRISRPRFLAEAHMRRLKQASFVFFLQYIETVGWVFWHVKLSPR